MTFASEGGGPVLVAVRDRARALRDRRRPDRSDRAHRLAESAGAHRACAAPAGCRARPGARRLRIWGWASRCSASSARPSGAPSASPSSSRARRSRSAATTFTSTASPIARVRTIASSPPASRYAATAKSIGVMEPSKHTFPSRGMTTSEAALMTRGFGQLYLSLGDPNPDGSIAVRHLSQAAGAADLARRGGDGVRWHRSRCRTGACASVRPSRRAAAPRCSRRSSDTHAIAAVADTGAGLRSGGADVRLGGAARRDPSRSGAGSAGARALQRAALHGLPEPVDRRFRGAARARICASSCASGSRPATAIRRCSIFWSRVTANSCCSSRASIGTRPCSGSARRRVLLGGALALIAVRAPPACSTVADAPAAGGCDAQSRRTTRLAGICSATAKARLAEIAFKSIDIACVYCVASTLPNFNPADRTL